MKKIEDVGKYLPHVSGLATDSALTAVENKIPIVNGIYEKIKSENIYISFADYNKFKIRNT